MQTARYLLLGFCLLLPAVAEAAAPADAIDCRSAIPPKGDRATFLSTCRARAAAERRQMGVAGADAAAAAEPIVLDSRTTLAGASWAGVPTWSDADIAAQFAATRDAPVHDHRR